jgi:hypothetical protein
MNDEINYAALIDSAMHSIVREALQIAAVEGLPGDHHFFISFMTQFPGVNLSTKLRQKYPEEMTIVLQYQFDSLEVFVDHFCVELSFDNVSEKVIVPFLALTAFADPSVKFGLQFRHVDMMSSSNDDDFFRSNHSAVVQTVHKDGSPSKKTAAAPLPEMTDNVISLDTFRKKDS